MKPIAESSPDAVACSQQCFRHTRVKLAYNANTLIRELASLIMFSLLSHVNLRGIKALSIMRKNNSFTKNTVPRLYILYSMFNIQYSIRPHIDIEY